MDITVIRSKKSSAEAPKKNKLRKRAYKNRYALLERIKLQWHRGRSLV